MQVIGFSLQNLFSQKKTLYIYIYTYISIYIIHIIIYILCSILRKKMCTIIEKILYFPQHHLIRFDFWASRQGRQPGSQMPWIYRQIGKFRK